jgi:hypothetical protein
MWIFVPSADSELEASHIHRHEMKFGVGPLRVGMDQSAIKEGLLFSREYGAAHRSPLPVVLWSAGDLDSVGRPNPTVSGAFLSP